MCIRINIEKNFYIFDDCVTHEKNLALHKYVLVSHAICDPYHRCTNTYAKIIHIQHAFRETLITRGRIAFPDERDDYCYWLVRKSWHISDNISYLKITCIAPKKKKTSTGKKCRVTRNNTLPSNGGNTGQLTWVIRLLRFAIVFSRPIYWYCLSTSNCMTGEV